MEIRNVRYIRTNESANGQPRVPGHDAGLVDPTDGPAALARGAEWGPGEGTLPPRQARVTSLVVSPIQMKPKIGVMSVCRRLI